MLRSIDAMPNPNAAPLEPQPEPQRSPEETQKRAALEQHLNAMIGRLQVEVGKPEGPERLSEIENITGEYVLGLLDGMIGDDGQFEAQLIQKGARDTNGNWNLASDLFIFLTDEMARSVPTRLEALGTPGGYRDVRELNVGMIRQIKNLVARYTPKIDPYEDRRQPPAAAA